MRHVAIYFGLGILSDLIVTGYYICVAHNWAWAASLISIPIALLNFYVLGNVLVRESSSTRKWYWAMAYAVGNAIGCFAVMFLLNGRGS